MAGSCLFDRSAQARLAASATIPLSGPARYYFETASAGENESGQQFRFEWVSVPGYKKA
jgi:hypothetical protein